MLRILHVVTDMRRGGLETMLMNYYRNLDREKIQFDFLTHREYLGDYGKEILELGGKLYHILPLNPFSKKYKDQVDKFFKIHREYRIVHVHQDCMSSVVLKIAKKNGVPVRIAHSHAASQDRNLKYFVKIYYKKLIPQYATQLLACSESAGKFMFGKHKFSILKNAIYAQKYTYNEDTRINIRKRLGLSDKFVVGLVGRFSPAKNHEFLLDVFSKVVNIEPKAHLLLVGDGKLRFHIENKIKKLNIENNVTLLGVRDDVADLLQSIDIFVFPSIYEGLGISVIEAQAAGLYCIISDGVPKETIVTDLVEQIPLIESKEIWSKEILAYRYYSRRSTYQEIIDAGYDIKFNAKKLQDFYLNVL